MSDNSLKSLLQASFQRIRNLAAGSLVNRIDNAKIADLIQTEQPDLVDALRMKELAGVAPADLAARMIVILQNSLRLAKVDFVRQALSSASNMGDIKIANLSPKGPACTGYGKFTFDIECIISPSAKGSQSYTTKMKLVLPCETLVESIERIPEVKIQSVKVDNVLLNSDAEISLLSNQALGSGIKLANFLQAAKEA